MLRIEHLTKNFGEKKAVDDLNLHIAPGEIYGFIGHNGAGKTTTLKSVAGILQFDAGEIYIDGKSIRTQPLECKRSFAYMKTMNTIQKLARLGMILSKIAFVFSVIGAVGSVVGIISMALGAATVQSCGNTPKRLR